MTRSLARVKRLVVKIGSLLLVDPANGRLRTEWLKALAEDLARVRARGQEAVVVSSGAIALGRGLIGLPGGPLRLEDSQAAAAAGQIRLAHAYQEALAGHDVSVAQILLTIGDTEERRRYLNARSTINRLLQHGAIPVINENDTVATTEIRFGDNDRLAARVAQMVDADCLVLLSDIDGLYTADPETDPAAALIPEVTAIGPEIEACAGKLRPGYSSGGMVTKLQAAKIALGAGCHMVIADGKPRHPLARIENGARCHLVRRRLEPADRAQAVDRRHSDARGHPDHRRRGGAGAGGGQEPAAGGRHGRRRELRSRRRGRRPRPAGARGRARPVRLFGRRRGPHHGPQKR